MAIERHFGILIPQRKFAQRRFLRFELDLRNLATVDEHTTLSADREGAVAGVLETYAIRQEGQVSDLISGRSSLGSRVKVPSVLPISSLCTALERTTLRDFRDIDS